ncbi:MAG TPA: hypothetical protein VN256_20700 [Pyrinomonadaceae bacterium]|nr:hypothetical protein [Pyrinomonadaceae bacterium]
MDSRFERIQRQPLPGDKLKLGFAVAAAAYFLWAAAHPDSWRLIDGVNLVIHEAGHVVFRPFGEFLAIAGGSLFQVIVPAVFAGYFYFNNKPYSCALVLFWAGESLLNVSVYAADSVAMQLPLLGGDNSIHDWNYLLEHLGLLRQTAGIAFLIRALGTLLIIFAAAWAIRTALRPSKLEFEG